MSTGGASLRVAAGGFLGLGETKFLIPVDAVTKVDEKAVYVDQTRGHLVRGRQYDPDLINMRYLSDICAHYGYEPYWGPGYKYPMFPLFPF